jgi:DNA topoisomerase VI subunit B
MALQAFHANPSIGGFGGESTPLFAVRGPVRNRNQSTPPNSNEMVSVSSNHPSRPVNQGSDGSGDALCQIVKELVDNAVDACSSNEKHKRIRVEIKPYDTFHGVDGVEDGRSNHDESEDDDSRNEILQISVLDNGSGMGNIQMCVNAFHSSKRHDIDADDSKEAELQASGRYGIGLTLCLLHAQRLIPNSYTCITSTTRESTHRTRAFFVVNTLGDAVECHREEVIDKKDPTESGTCVSLLVPVRKPSEDQCCLVLPCYPYSNDVRRLHLTCSSI